MRFLSTGQILKGKNKNNTEEQKIGKYEIVPTKNNKPFDNILCNQRDVNFRIWGIELF